MRKAIVHPCLGNRAQVRAILLPLFLGGISCLAQPSGGPYGPVQQSYAVPADAAHIYFVAPDGKADSVGGGPDAPTTLESAVDRATTADAIVMRGGMYRTGNLKLNQGITMQPYEGERPVLNGTRVTTNRQCVCAARRFERAGIDGVEPGGGGELRDGIEQFGRSAAAASGV